MGNKNEYEHERIEKVVLSQNSIEEEIKIWESIKSCNYKEKSILFYKTVNIDEILEQLYKAKRDNKVVEMSAKSLNVYYYSEDERRRDEEERRRREEEQRNLQK